MNAEILYDMPDADYFAIDALNASTLKQMVNPERYKWSQENPKTSPALQFGTDFHDYVLRGKMPTDGEDMVVCPFDSYRTKEAKAWKEENQDKRIITQKELAEMDAYTDQLGAMAEAVYDMPEALEVHDVAEKEVVILWERMTKSGRKIKCKAKLDWFDHASRTYNYDLKSCSDLANFDRDCINFGYYISAAWYCEAVYEAVGERRGFKFVVAGKDEPYQACIKEIPEDMLALGGQECEDLADVWARCKEKGVWPSPYAKDSSLIEVPYWWRREKGLV